MFQNDAGRAEHTRQQIERNPLPIKIRYLTESIATDDSDDIRRVAVPPLALRPGFSKSVLYHPANAWFKTSFVDAWERFSPNANIQLTTLPDAGVLIFDDQPTATNEAVVRFLQQVWSYSTVQRTHEIGIRMALGAGQANVLGTVVSSGLRPVAVGIAIGLVVSALFGRALGTQLVEVTAHDPRTLAAAAALLTTIAAFACWIPARRAARVDPLVALRRE